ncbi:MAG TPA: restriction endonuclease [Candidatus Dormibacteraeota bacterium]|nr:restriction endonuclease [Candidatus Dormibacteraeota bacterium]
MSGEQFEDMLAFLFEQHGLLVELTPTFGDYGCDLIASRLNERSLVQAKRSNQAVGLRAVQEAVAALAHWSCQRAMVITNSSFTAEAQALAASNRVELWDRARLVAELSSVSLLDTRLPDVVPACRKCGAAMIIRRPKAREPFYGCSTFPRCWHKLPAAAGKRLVLVPAPAVVEPSAPTAHGLRRLLERLVS